MTDWNLSIVIIVPAALQDKANRLACALGHDVLPGNTFSVPLSDNPSQEVSHYGCRTAAKQEFVDIINAAGAGMLPEDFPLDEFGVTVQDVQDVIAAQIMDVRSAGEMLTHFDDVAAANDLQRVMVELLP